MQLMEEAGIVDLIILKFPTYVTSMPCWSCQCEKSSNKTNFLSREVKMEVSQWRKDCINLTQWPLHNYTCFCFLPMNRFKWCYQVIVPVDLKNKSLAKHVAMTPAQGDLCHERLISLNKEMRNHQETSSVWPHGTERFPCTHDDCYWWDTDETTVEGMNRLTSDEMVAQSDRLPIGWLRNFKQQVEFYIVLTGLESGWGQR